jgi:hypothetical protein
MKQHRLCAAEERKGTAQGHFVATLWPLTQDLQGEAEEVVFSYPKGPKKDSIKVEETIVRLYMDFTNVREQKSWNV